MGAIAKSRTVFIFLLYISVFLYIFFVLIDLICRFFIFFFTLVRVLLLCGLHHKSNFIYSENVLFSLRVICDEFYFDTKSLT